MKRSALIFPAIAVVLAVVIGVLAGPFSAHRASGAASLAFDANFAGVGDLGAQFDVGYSGPNPWDWGGGTGDGAITSFHGDHDMSCGAPTTDRTVAFGGDRANLDYSQVFWQCLPGGDPAKGHIMTGVDTVSYNIAWFAPKPTFTNVAKVCWDQNLTTMSVRKWTHVMFVSPSDAIRYPVGTQTLNGSQARGSGGYDLGYTEPGFRDPSGSTTGVIPRDANAGLKVVDGGAQWWEDDTFTGPNWGDIPSRGYDGYSSYPQITDKAARYTICVENVGDSQISISMDDPSGTPRTALASGHIPAGPVRVVFGDDNYNPEKGAEYDPNVVTWHWDNVRVFTDPGGTATTVAPTTTTTVAPTTTTTVAPTTTTTTAPPTTTTTTTAPPTTTTTEGDGSTPTTEPGSEPTGSSTTTTTAPPPTTTTAPPTTTTTAPPTTTTTAPPTTTTAPPTTTTTAPPPSSPSTTSPPAGPTPTTVRPSPSAPVVEIVSSPDGQVTGPDVEIVFDVADPGGATRLQAVTTATCALDGAAAEPCTSPKWYRGLEPGAHEVTIAATDGDGAGRARVRFTVATDDALVLGEAVTNEPGGTTAPPPADPTVVGGVLAYTGAHISELTILGVLLVAMGVLLGLLATYGRRRST